MSYFPNFTKILRLHLTLVWSSNEMKLQYMKDILQIAHFHIRMVSITAKQAHVINKLGRFGTGFLLHQYVEPAVNRQSGFRRELAEQITLFIIKSRNFLHGELLKYELSNPEFLFRIFMKIRKFHYFFNVFGWRRSG